MGSRHPASRRAPLSSFQSPAGGDGAGGVALVARCGTRSIDRLWVVLPLACFLVLLVVHALVLNAKERGERARRYYLRGVARLDGSWPGTGPDGARFSEGHPYARDLDLFGPGSLFQLLDTARTEIGEDTLADWLREGATIEVIGARQAAVSELRDRLEFRETLATRTPMCASRGPGTLARWTASGPEGFLAGTRCSSRRSRSCRARSSLRCLADLVPLGIALLWLAVQAVVASIWRARVARVIRGVDAATYDLGLLSELLACIERESFTSPRLRALHAALVSGGSLPSQTDRDGCSDTSRRATRCAIRSSVHSRCCWWSRRRRRSRSIAGMRAHASRSRARGFPWSARSKRSSSLATYAYEHPRDPFPRAFGRRSGVHCRRSRASADS